MDADPGRPFFSIRPASAGDYEALSDILTTTRKSAFYWLPPEKIIGASFAEQTQGEEIHVAEWGERGLVGFVSIWEPDNFIHHFYIHPRFQGLGIGKGFMSHIVACYGLPLKLKCLSKNAPALAFYRARNWVEAGFGMDENGEYINMILKSYPKPDRTAVKDSIPTPGRLEADAL